MSGRGLGHTGGTLDKLESIPGYRIDLDDRRSSSAVLRDVGTSIIGQTASLAPGRQEATALRDVTATIASIPLIAASIMSKKLAEGQRRARARREVRRRGVHEESRPTREALAERWWPSGTHAGVRTEAFITDMEAPLGRAVEQRRSK